MRQNFNKETTLRHLLTLIYLGINVFILVTSLSAAFSIDELQNIF